MADLVGLEASGRRSRPQPAPITKRTKASVGSLPLFAVLGLLGLAAWDLRIGRRALINGQGFTELGRFFRAAVTPKVTGETLRLVWSGTVTTLSYAMVGTVLSAVFGFGLAVVATGARQDDVEPSVYAKFIGALMVPIRGIHEVLWALIFINLLGINPLVAVLAIALPFSAVSAKVFAELFSAQPRQPFDALRALGAGRSTAFAYGVLPNAGRDCISYGFYRFECAIRSAAVLGVVGAGGLGYQLLLSFQSADYREMWTFIWALIALSAVADWLSSRVRRQQQRTTPSHFQRTSPPGLLVGVFLGLGLLAAISLHLDVTTLWSTRTREQWSYLVANWLPPDLHASYLRELTNLARETLAISVGSMVVAAAIAVAGSLCSARLDGQRRSRRGAGWVVRALLLVARSVPAAVWAYLAVIAFFSGPFPAAIALGVYNGGVLGRMLGEVVENLDRRPRAALLASGASGFTASAYGSVPIAAPSYVTYGLYRWEVAMRETVVVGIAAAGGLGAHMKQLLAAFAWPKLVTSIAVMILLTLFVDALSAHLRRRLVH
jgi:phosphonate transport system permease protein